MKIQDISIFGEYKQPENRVTAAFLQICKIGGESLIRYYLNKLSLSLPSSEIDIETQVKEGGSIPDGRLSSTFTFNLYVESKVKSNSINFAQLGEHQKTIKSRTDYLLYLTPDSNRPKLPESVYWANWEDTLFWFNDYLQTNEDETNQVLEFLIQNFNTLLDNMGLLGKKWNFDNENVIVLAGAWAESIALKYHCYICQNKRSFKSAKYLSFFNNNQVSYVFEIETEPEDDVDLREKGKLKEFLQDQEPNYSGDRKKVIFLKPGTPIGPIINDKRDKNGNLCPFTYGQPRYTTYHKLVKATKTSEL